MATKAAGTKLQLDRYEMLRWLAYKRNTTISNIIAQYVEFGLVAEQVAGKLDDMPGRPDDASS
jgi:hypothetical protein